MHTRNNTTDEIQNNKNTNKTVPIKTPLIRKDLYHRSGQPTITSWIEKHGDTSNDKKTRPERKIHLPTQTRMKQLQENGTPGGKTQENTY